MRQLVLFVGLMCGVSFWGADAIAKQPTKLVVLDFEEQGKVAKGAGKTLGMLLYSSISPRRYYMMDPNKLKSLFTTGRSTLDEVKCKSLKILANILNLMAIAIKYANLTRYLTR